MNWVSSPAPGKPPRETVAPDAPAVALEGVEVKFGAVTALAGLSQVVGRGERVAVIGASGAGKSTLFNVLTRAVPLRRGRVHVEGVDIMALGPRAPRAARRRIGVIYQSYGLVPQLSVGMNVALGEVADLSAVETMRTFAMGPGSATSSRVLAALERVGLADRVADRGGDLSGGQQQRVAVARLLLQGPSLILADEPVSAVDPVTTARVLGALRDSADEHGATLLVNLHDVALARSFPRVVALRGGAVAFDGPPEDMNEEVLARIYAPEPPRAPTEMDAPAPSPLERPSVPVLSKDREGYGLRAR